MPDPESGYRVVEATADYQKVLTYGIDAQFPQISKLNELNPFISREEPYCLFAYRKTHQPGYDPKLLLPILSTSLHAATDENDPAFSYHGSHHDTFNEAADKLKELVNKQKSGDNPRSLERHLQDGSREVRLPTGELKRVPTLVLAANPYVREIYRPGPHDTAAKILEGLTLEGEERKQLLYSEIRRIARKKEPTFAVLTAFYANLTIKDIFDIFSNQQWRDGIMKIHPHAHLPTTRITKSHSDVEVLTQVRTILEGRRDLPLSIVSSSQDYMAALNFLSINHYPVALTSISRGDFVSSKHRVYPVAVFQTASEAAEIQADPAYLDPGRAKFIDEKYDGMTTSKIKTMYLRMGETVR